MEDQERGVGGEDGPQGGGTQRRDSGEEVVRGEEVRGGGREGHLGATVGESVW